MGRGWSRLGWALARESRAGGGLGSQVPAVAKSVGTEEGK